MNQVLIEILTIIGNISLKFGQIILFLHFTMMTFLSDIFDYSPLLLFIFNYSTIFFDQLTTLFFPVLTSNNVTCCAGGAAG